MFSVALGGNVLEMSVKSIWFNILCKADVSLFKKKFTCQWIFLEQQNSVIFIILCIHILFFFWAGSFLLRRVFFNWREWGRCSSCSKQASLIVEHRLQGVWLQQLWCVWLGSCRSWALEYRFSSCGAWAYLPCGVWDRPGAGTEPMSPALVGGILYHWATKEALMFPHWFSVWMIYSLMLVGC